METQKGPKTESEIINIKLMAMIYKKNWNQKSIFIWILALNSIKLNNKNQVTQMNEHTTEKA